MAGTGSGNPGDKWGKVKLVPPVTSDMILEQLNVQKEVVTAAFVQQCTDGLYLFLGFYGS